MAGVPQPSATDPLARHAAIGIAVVRVGIGIGALALTRPALRSLGFADPDGPSVALARLAGGRDIALGLHGLLVRDDRGRLRQSSLVAAAVDAGDAGAFAAALVRRDGIDRTALLNLPIAASAAALGVWVAARLRPAAPASPSP
jgi:hypothetical protein